MDSSSELAGSPTAGDEFSLKATLGDSAGWETWWAFNQEPYLRIKEEVHRAHVTWGSDGHFLGRSGTDVFEDPLRPSRAEVLGEIVPALLAVLAEERDDDLLAAALMSLGRIGAESVPSLPAMTRSVSSFGVEDELRKYIRHKNVHVAEKAVLALGIYGSERSVLLLSDILRNGPEGRRAAHDASVHERLRSYAAYALGLIGNRSRNEDVRRYIASTLTQIVEEWHTGPRDLPVACVSALGVVPLAVAEDYQPPEHTVAACCRQGQVRWLLDLFLDRSMNYLVRAHVPRALGRLLADMPQDSELRAAAAGALTNALSRRSASVEREVRQSSALGLGIIGDADADALDRSIRRTLLQTATTEGDETVRHFAQIALAQVASRPGSGKGSPVEGTFEVRRFFLKQLSHGRSADRPWTALALGVLGHGLGEVREVSDAEVVDTLRLYLSRARSTREVGAYGIGLGLQGAPQASRELLRALEEHADDDTRAQVALALGLLRAREASETLREAVRSSRFRPSLHSRAAVGLTLVGDKSGVPILIEMLEQAGSFSSRSSTAFALGRIGDSRAITSLLELLRDEEASSKTRAVAALALGIVADKDPLPWQTVYAVDLNYLAATPTLTGACGILDTP